ncbi:MAG: hypothetical protein JWM27_2674, partial [Gemmatimonadetes bacterium]|nr:hypothetical protein [Gemmatimonadota bacterium]
MIAAGAVVPAPPRSGAADPVGDPLPVVRAAVRSILERTPAYAELEPEQRRAMAHAMVTVCHAAASLIREEALSEHEIAAAAAGYLSPDAPAGFSFDPAHQPYPSHAAYPSNPPNPSYPSNQPNPSNPSTDTRTAPSTAQALGVDGGAGPNADAASAGGYHDEPLATAQNAQQEFGGTAVDRIAGTARSILNAVSFPRFVNELITGVFKAVVDSTQTQLHQYVELLNNVAASVEGFADSNMGPDRARAWLVERYPGSYEWDGDADDPADRDPGEAPPERKLRRKGNGQPPTEAQLRTDLALDEGESASAANPETLVPLARRRLAKMRQEMLATMVQMGMQRIVIDSGRITAAMRLHIDATSAAEQDKGSRFDMTNTVNAQASFGVGPWGASASIQNTIGYVTTENTRTTESMHADVELTSSVELNFRSDYVPLNRLASPGQATAIQGNSRNPDFEAARTAESARRASEATTDAARIAGMNTALQPRAVAPSSAPPLPAASPASPAPAP